MDIFPILYARDSKGEIKMWNIWVESNSLGADICRKFGQLGGKLQEKRTQITSGKNIGKSNETTPFEQACSEAESKWKRQKDRGYKELSDVGVAEKEAHKGIEYLGMVLDQVLPESNTDASGNIKPMKAQPYYKKSNGQIAIKFPDVCGQPKINGVRCTAQYTDNGWKLLSKEGKEYNLSHILEQLERDMPYNYDGTELIYDGELYIHGELLQDIRSAVVKPNLNTPRVTLEIFDLAIPYLTQQERIYTLNDIGTETTPNINIVPTVYITTDIEAQKYCDNCIEKGYEGAIFRHIKAEYKFGKRPMTMVKLKRRESAEFKVIAVIPMPKEPDLGMFVCENDLNDKHFKVVPEGSKELKRQYLIDANKLIGQQLTVEFYERTKDDVPFHAIGITIRDYE